MRSSAIFFAALVGVASAGMPGWSVKSSETASGDINPTGKPHLGPGPVSERPRPEASFSAALSKDHHDHHLSGYSEDHHGKSQYPTSGGSLPTGYPKDHHSERHHTSAGIFPSTGIVPSGGTFPSGGPKKHHSEKYHHVPTGSGVGPTGTGHGRGPHSTLGPHTTTITTTSDVTSKYLDRTSPNDSD